MSTQAVDIETYHNFPLLLRYNAQNFGSDVAMREKEFGIWVEYTWAQCQQITEKIAIGLSTFGIEKDAVIALIGDNRPNWVFGYIAAHALGANSLGIYRDCLNEEVEYLLNYTQAKIVLAEDEEQCDKLLELADRLPYLQHIVYFDPRGMRKYDDKRLINIADVMKTGEQLLTQDGNLYNAAVEKIAKDQMQILCTTSGTTSKPKLVMLHSTRILRHCVDYLAIDGQTSQDNYVSLLPLPWIMEQIYVMGKGLISRMQVNFVEEQESLMSDLREIGPNFLLLAPRVWETILAEINARMLDSSRFRQWMFNVFTNRALKAVDEGKCSWLAEWCLMRWLRDHFGLKNVTSAATGGAAIGESTYQFFIAMGVPLRQLYGQTELAGAYTIHTHDDVDIETVGVTFENSHYKIENPDSEGVGEVYAKTIGMFSGYLHNEQAYQDDMAGEWLKTGDAGYIKSDNAHLVIIDRVSDLCDTAAGLRFSPQYIENKLKFSQYISEAVILGKGRDYLSAIICIRFSTVSKWAEKKGITFTNYTNLASLPEVAELIKSEVEKVNTQLNLAIERFILLYKELDADDGEVTRTHKVRRGVITDKYSDIIESLYSDRNSVHIDTIIHYQDGSESKVVTDLEIIKLAE